MIHKTATAPINIFKFPNLFTEIEREPAKFKMQQKTFKISPIRLINADTLHVFFASSMFAM